ncbi:MAG TPA: TMEM165/GDT1 family protein [Pseudonocardiaceae bacterium]|nr:TMEM165/GDT1 family protein [Pseudonocardiaceae bacterium]
MSPVVLGTVFGVVFIGELPDKTMFASLLLAAKGRAGLVWMGAASAFLLHVAIAVTVGGVLFTLLPHRLVQGVVALMFLIGAVMAFRSDGEDDDDVPGDTGYRIGGARTIGTAFLVIFVAEWGDLTQILTANMAARYDNAIEVGIAATAALWAVAGVAMVAGRLIRNLPVALVRRITGIVLLVLAGLSAFDALTGSSTLV